MRQIEKNQKTVSIATLGCKSNRYDTGAIEEMLKAGGLAVVGFPSRADAYVINTCTVTGGADSESRAAIRRARNLNPDAVVIVTGCYAQVSSGEISRIGGVDYILGNPQKGRVLEYVAKGRPAGGPLAVVGGGVEGTPIGLRSLSSGGRTRVNLKVQDGCGRSCAYCIIPRARGASRSLPLAQVESEIGLLVEKGFREIVLTGIHLGAYGADLDPRAGICDIIKVIERIGPGRARFRISSLDPDEVTDEFIDMMKTSRNICNHLHLPLQSGDDAIIRLMRRPYTAAFFEDRVRRLFDSVPGISIGVDVIAGFPGEGAREFENTLSLINDLPVSYLHIFPYSRRNGTPAAAFRGQADPGVLKDRCARLKGLDALKRDGFYSGFIGKEAEVLIEASRDKTTGMFRGKARNYVTVSLDAPEGLARTVARVRLTGIKDGVMTGEIKDAQKD